MPPSAPYARRGKRKLIRHTKTHGIDKKVSCKSLSAQKAEAKELGDKALEDFFDREAQEHLGPALAYKTKKLLEENGFDNENIDDTLGKIYEMNARAFCVVMDKIKKAQKTAKLRYEKQLELEKKEKAYTEQKLEGLIEKETIDGEKIYKDVRALIADLKTQIGFNDFAVEQIDKQYMTDSEISAKALAEVTNGVSVKVNKVREELKIMHEELSKRRDFFAGLPNDKLRENGYDKYIENVKYYKTLFRAAKAKSEEIIATWSKPENKDKLDRITEALLRKRDEDMKNRKLFIECREEYVKLYNKAVEVCKSVNPKVDYEVPKGKYKKPTFCREAEARTNRELDAISYITTSCKTFEHIKRNKMTIDIHSKEKKKANFWEM